MDGRIIIKGAREHNLKNIDIELPRNRFVVLTGLSGSGKSSLAFDTLYAEGQRRYVESLSSYARQFLGQMEKPDVDYIEGLSPAISIDQKTTSRNPRSTVGTVTEIHDYLRLLYARIGVPHCPECGKEIRQQTIDQMVDHVLDMPEGTRISLLAPLVRGRKGEHQKLLEGAFKDGYVRVRVDGELRELSETIELDKKKKHTIEVVVDRLIVRPDIRKRLADSLETAMGLSGGLVVVAPQEGEEAVFSQNYACPDCGVSIEELEPRMFSFNSPFGACPTCTGLGTLMKIDPDLVVPDKTLSLADGAIQATGWNVKDPQSIASMFFGALSREYGFEVTTPFGELPKKVQDILLYGTKGHKLNIEYKRANSAGAFQAEFEGIVTNLERRYRETTSEGMKEELELVMSNAACPDCKGLRLKNTSLAVTVGGANIALVSLMAVKDAQAFFQDLPLSEKEEMISHQILKEIRARLGFLVNVGLDYLSLSRPAATLSGGESQRIRLATQIGSSLVGVMYILDEPSIGLHQKDNEKLLETLKHLRDLGNTLIVVEHDEDTMMAADHIVDIGPGAGIHGGYVVAEGNVHQIMANPKSITGQYLSGRRAIPIPPTRRVPRAWLHVEKATLNNLRGLCVNIPLGVMTCVTGVSGSGKSTLVNQIIYKALAHDLNRARVRGSHYERIDGIEELDKVIAIDQSPIGRTPRSNPATYTGVFDIIRDVFAQTPEAKARGYKNNRFSFNVKGGRCEACSGDGMLKIEMHFLPDIYVPCEVCKGKRYNRETLDVHYKGKNIYDILDMTVEDAVGFFENFPKILAKIQTLYDVGLGYIKLGQPSTQLSGGEAQRVKLATELSRRSTGRTLYILDEPTTGLHMADVDRLVKILQRLTESGNSVLIIEHNLDIIKTSDYIIDLGPDGGDRGGKIVAEGTPEQIAECEKSYTGQFLSRIFQPQMMGAVGTGKS